MSFNCKIYIALWENTAQVHVYLHLANIFKVYLTKVKRRRFEIFDVVWKRNEYVEGKHVKAIK
jgi:uncharacterized membrane protein